MDTPSPETISNEQPLDAALAGWDEWLVSMALELQRETGGSLH